MDIKGYSIRNAYEHECSLLSAIESESSKRFHLIGLTQVNIKRTAPIEGLQTAQRDNSLWVAVENSSKSIVGFAYVRTIASEPHLEEIDVLPSHGRKGIGTALIKTVLKWAHTNRFKKLTLSTFSTVPWNMPFYQKLGFKVFNQQELSQALQKLKDAERSIGLPMGQRVIMYYPLSLT